MRFRRRQPSRRYYAREGRRWKRGEQKILADPCVFTVGVGAHQWAEAWVIGDLTAAPLHEDSFDRWSAALGMELPYALTFEMVINAVLQRAVSDGAITVPEPGTIKSKSNVRDPFTETTIGIGLGFVSSRTKRLTTASPETLMYADLNARPELGVDAAVALLRAASDIMRAPRHP
ncbi:hypothetical protein [Nocardia sp. NPDC058666]|uniref:hypothetical protein n=1 Tax=Nocardia sp. NPDC058666 TaxID=3346587 RepID=UPI003661F77B